MRVEERMLKEAAKDHLLSHTNETELTLINKAPYELFHMVYVSIQDVIEERERARSTNDFEAFQVAGERFWQYGQALLTFAIAKSLGWMKDYKPVEQNRDRIDTKESIERD
ncbi:hypothetical protein ACFVS2_20945 [Brevibacillus sp. NPDC058079]|uniref:hypothetical protein n=1 Tax=Brevibacillus sp. NPDC058079 TaxID=3346330 RepID=UPI0036E8A996